MATRADSYLDNLKQNKYNNEDHFKATHLSVEVRSPKINSSIRDRSCIVVFPRGDNPSRLNRGSVEEVMMREWGELYKHVVHFGNIDFSRKWVFTFDTTYYNDLAVSKEIFINKMRIKTVHATRKFNELKVDWVPTFTNLDDLAEVICELEGVTGKFVDIRWARGDKINKDSTQVILRFYTDPNEEFNPPPYIHYRDEYDNRIFLHLTVRGKASKCMRCLVEGHLVASCPYFFCHTCKKLCLKEGHTCERYTKKGEYTERKKDRNEEKEQAKIDSILDEIDAELEEHLSPKTKEMSIHQSKDASKCHSFENSFDEINRISKDKPFFSKTMEDNATLSAYNKSQLSGRMDHYEGKQVVLGKGGVKDKERITPPVRPSNPKQARTDIISYRDAFINQINFTSSPRENMFFDKMEKLISPIKDSFLDDKTEFPGLGTEPPDEKSPAINKNNSCASSPIISKTNVILDTKTKEKYGSLNDLNALNKNKENELEMFDDVHLTDSVCNALNSSSSF